MNQAEFAAMAQRLAEKCCGAELRRVEYKREVNAPEGSGPVEVKEMWSLHAYTGDWYHVTSSMHSAETAEERLVTEIEERRAFDRFRAMNHEQAAASLTPAGDNKPPKVAAPSVQPVADERERRTAG